MRYKLSTPTLHPMGIIPRSCLCVASKLASVSSKLQQAPGKHEPDGPLAHSDVLEEGKPHFPPPRAIKVHFLHCKEEKKCFWLAFSPNNELRPESLTRRLSALKSKPEEDISLLLHRMTAETLPDVHALVLLCWVHRTPPASQPSQSRGLLGQGGFGNVPLH